MKAVILAAGKGTRMLPLTETVPKVLVEVNGKPFLSYVIDNLKEAGFTEFGIVVGYMKEKIISYCEENDINATFIEQHEQKGTGHAVMLAKEFVSGEEFVVVAGDNIWSVADLNNLNVNDDYCYVSAYSVEDPSRFGVLIKYGEYLQKIVEKPETFVGNLVNVSAYKFTPEIFGALGMIEPSLRGELEITDAISLLAKEKRVKVLELQDYWFDLATPSDIKVIGDFLSKDS
jgi:glucose-1-phosphate thymidylyltransferase